MPGPDLVCARCSGLVRDGGCSTCRVTRQRDTGPSWFTAEVLVLLLALVVALGLAAHVLR